MSNSDDFDVFLSLFFPLKKRIDNFDDGAFLYVASSCDDHLELVHLVLDHWVEEEYGMHFREFCRHLNSK